MMSSAPGAIAAIATPPGTGGIAVIRLSGADALELAARVFKPKSSKKSLEGAKGYTALYGEFIGNKNDIIDDGVALVFRAPHSYTGEDVVELSCHGGEAVSRAVLQACLLAGAQPAAPGEYTRRALLNGRLSLDQAEALGELIATHSRQGAAVARAAMGGVLQRQINDMKQTLVTLAGHLAAWTDYPDEDVEELPVAQFQTTVAGVRGQLQSLVDGFGRGSMLRRGVRTVIVGSPNVGKSTLFNLLSGFERAIVTPVAGTTRDVVTEEIDVGGVVLRLADTAGLHHTGDEVEREGIRRSLDELEQAGFAIAVFDGSQPLTPADLELARRCQGRPALAVVNKSDLGTRADTDALFPFFSEVIVVSALHPATTDVLEKAILRTVSLNEVDAGAAALVSQRQLAAAREARDALDDAQNALAGGLGLDAAGVCLDDALRALAAITGEDASDAVINEVFSTFCVGK